MRAGREHIPFTGARGCALRGAQRASDLGERNTRPTVGVRSGGANPGGGPGNPHSVTSQRTERPPHTPAGQPVHALHGDCTAARERERQARGPPPSLSAGAGATETSFPAVGLSRATDGTAR